MLYLLHAGAWLNPEERARRPTDRRIRRRLHAVIRPPRRARPRRLAGKTGCGKRGAGLERLQQQFAGLTLRRRNSRWRRNRSKRSASTRAPTVSGWSRQPRVGDAVDLKPLPNKPGSSTTIPHPNRSIRRNLRKLRAPELRRISSSSSATGWGQGAVKLAGLHAHGRPQSLVMEQLPVKRHGENGLSKQQRHRFRGQRNRTLERLQDQQRLHRRDAGKTADAFHRRGGSRLRPFGWNLSRPTSSPGATPAAFSAHVPHRGMAQEIAEQQAKTGYQILIGNGGETVPAQIGKRDPQG